MEPREDTMPAAQVTLTCSINPEDRVDFQVEDGELWCEIHDYEYFIQVREDQLPALIKLLTDYAIFKGVTL